MLTYSQLVKTQPGLGKFIFCSLFIACVFSFGYSLVWHLLDLWSLYSVVKSTFFYCKFLTRLNFDWPNLRRYFPQAFKIEQPAELSMVKALLANTHHLIIQPRMSSQKSTEDENWINFLFLSLFDCWAGSKIFKAGTDWAVQFKKV